MLVPSGATFRNTRTLKLGHLNLQVKLCTDVHSFSTVSSRSLTDKVMGRINFRVSNRKKDKYRTDFMVDCLFLDLRLLNESDYFPPTFYRDIIRDITR